MGHESKTQKNYRIAQKDATATDSPEILKIARATDVSNLHQM